MHVLDAQFLFEKWPVAERRFLTARVKLCWGMLDSEGSQGATPQWQADLIRVAYNWSGQVLLQMELGFHVHA